MTLDPREITEHLRPRWAHVAVECLGRVDSTNDWLARAALKRPTVVAAEEQTMGRGRRERRWASPPGGIYVSVGWQIRPGASIPTALPLAVAVYLCEGLDALGISGVSLKWPNDLVVNGAKLAGVLVECVDRAPGRSLLIGMGLNLETPSEAAELPADRRAIGLADVGVIPAREALVTAAASAALEAGSLEERTISALMRQRWPVHDALAGRACTIEQANGETLHGVADGVTEGGALRLDTADGLRILWSGECRVRGGWE
ncbi:biotin--[acetyl-CoA-carboxylase] ligase [Spiribacter onubensis]|uniref:biotin--[biotin carboxyl-carrier protein] ligase n=1 Tax=Spiribacter onubensis TaxID=3122420 RepID=A0ABV3SBY3_9GAMM